MYQIFFSSHSYDILPHSNPIPTVPTTFTLSTPSHCSWKEWKVTSAEITLQDNCCSHGICCHYVDHWLISPCAQDNFLRLWPIKFAFISTLYSGSCHNYTMPKLYNPFRGTCLEGVAQKCCYSFKKTGLYWDFNLDHADVRLVSSMICRRGSVGPR